jgi:uncharacterized membrane protein YhaH (DUF805 family)
MEYFTDAIEDWSNFTGRASRQEYWMFILIYFGLAITIAIVDSFITSGLIYGLFSLVMIVPTVSITARRLHDSGRTGWWQLIAFVPLVGFFILLFLLVLGSSDLGNPYED